MEKDYWIKRFEYLEKMQMVNESKYMEELTKQYVVALEKIKKEIQQWFIRFSVNNQISLQEAKRWLDSNELNELKWDINEYIKYGKENGIDLIWRKELENASAKVHISRLNGLMLQIKEQVEKLYTLQEEDTSKFIIDSYKDTYYTTAYELQKGYNVGFNINVLDDILIKKLISKPWATDNMTFSGRIWRNKKELIHILENDLTQSILKGEAPDQVIEKISKTFKTSRSKAGRLVMTESAFFSSAARKDCFNNLWVQKYEIVATLDSHTSDICRELDGKVFDMKDYEVGITAPPFHCWCRSVTAPYFNDEFTEGEQRIYRDEEGKRGYVDSKMSYQEWHNKYVENEIKFKVKKKPKHIYTKVQLEEMAKKANNIVKNYTNNESKWSGNIILTKNKTVKEWNCDISVDEYCSLDMLIHEQLHSHSISYYDRQTYKENWKIEEATVQLLTQEICKRNKISYIESEYDKMVNTLRAINKKAKLYKNDLKLAKELIKIPVTERIDFLQQKVYNKAIENISVEEYQKIFKKIEEFLI